MEESEEKVDESKLEKAPEADKADHADNKASRCKRSKRWYENIQVKRQAHRSEGNRYGRYYKVRRKKSIITF